MNMKNGLVNKQIVSISSIILMVLLIICIIIPLSSAHALNAFTNDVESAQFGIVRVICVIDSENISSGTGFAVGMANDDASIFVTNYHVVADNRQEVYITITDLQTLIPANIMYFDEEKDLALLQINTPLTERHPIPLLSPTKLTKSQDVFCLGFPGVADYFSDSSTGSSSIEDITITKGSASNTQYRMNGVSCILTDAVINHGNSGGPMTDAYGQVVGVNSWGIGEQMNVAISIDYIIQLLDDKGIPFSEGQPGGFVASPVPTLSASPSPIITDQTPTSPQMSTPKVESNPPIHSYASIFIIGGSALVLFIVLTILSLILRSKPLRAKGVDPHKNATSKESHSIRRARPINQTLMVVCETGAVAGVGVSVKSTLIIGRDSHECAIVFPNGTPGISMLHCKLEPSKDGIILTDLNSSYGTFLPHGIRLSPNKPYYLQVGDTFYIASEATRFVIGVAPQPVA